MLNLRRLIALGFLIAILVVVGRYAYLHTSTKTSPVGPTASDNVATGTPPAPTSYLDSTPQEVAYASHYASTTSAVYLDGTLLIGADPRTFTLFEPAMRSDGYGGYMSDDTRYAHDKTHVYYQSRLLPSADPATFKLLEGDYRDEYAGDASHVYYLDAVIIGADPHTFVSLTWQGKEGCSPAPYSKDAKHVFYKSQVVEGADPNTFTAFQDGVYGKDKDHVYEGAQVRSDLDVKTFQYSCNYG
jgi:hypothetical protein